MHTINLITRPTHIWCFLDFSVLFFLFDWMAPVASLALTGSHLLLKLSTEVSAGILVVIVWNRLKLASDSGSFCLRLPNAEIRPDVWDLLELELHADVQLWHRKWVLATALGSSARAVHVAAGSALYPRETYIFEAGISEITGWPQILYITENDSELPVLLLSPKCWHYNVHHYAPLCSGSIPGPRAQYTNTVPTELCPQALAIVFSFLSLRFSKTVCIW